MRFASHWRFPFCTLRAGVLPGDTEIQVWIGLGAAMQRGTNFKMLAESANQSVLRLALSIGHTQYFEREGNSTSRY